MSNPFTKEFAEAQNARFDEAGRKRKLNHENLANSELQDSIAECHKAAALVRPISGEDKSFRRTVVRFVGYRVKPLDPDNFAGSVKDLLDGLRHANVIQGDEPWRIILETEQVRVATFKEEKTVIEIDLP